MTADLDTLLRDALADETADVHAGPELLDRIHSTIEAEPAPPSPSPSHRSMAAGGCRGGRDGPAHRVAPRWRG